MLDVRFSGADGNGVVSAKLRSLLRSVSKLVIGVGKPEHLGESRNAYQSVPLLKTELITLLTLNWAKTRYNNWAKTGLKQAKTAVELGKDWI